MSDMMDKGNVRIPKLLALAKGQPCQVCISGICNGNPETTVAAHSNSTRHGKGAHIKAHDFYVAYACSNCHDVIDGRAHVNKFSREDREYYWEVGHHRTMVYLWRNNLIRVA